MLSMWVPGVHRGHRWLYSHHVLHPCGRWEWSSDPLKSSERSLPLRITLARRLCISDSPLQIPEIPYGEQGKARVWILMYVQTMLAIAFSLYPDVYVLKTAPLQETVGTEISYPCFHVCLSVITSPPCLRLHNKRSGYPWCCFSIRTHSAVFLCLGMCPCPWVCACPWVCLLLIPPLSQSCPSLELFWTQPLQVHITSLWGALG